MKYEQRILVFMDVLGWSSFIERSIHDENMIRNLGICLHLLHETKNYHETTAQMGIAIDDIQVSLFSDSIAISAACKSNFDVFFLESFLSHNARHIQDHFIQLGFLIRGGVSFGDLIHNNKMIYGPALLKAIKLESEIAEHPRILLDQEIADRLKIDDKVTGSKVIYGNKHGYRKTFRQDNDGRIFFDFLQPFTNMPGTPVNKKLLTLNQKFNLKNYSCITRRRLKRVLRDRLQVIQITINGNFLTGASVTNSIGFAKTVRLHSP